MSFLYIEQTKRAHTDSPSAIGTHTQREWYSVKLYIHTYLPQPFTVALLVQLVLVYCLTEIGPQ